jgi:Tol biopolymer transport system component
MALAAGMRLGPYEVLNAIGAGGMGEVYKARDTRLERTVAIKVLPANLAGDSEFRARFEREAKSISALNHPHICTLYDVGRARVSGTPASQDDEVAFLVLEYLEGETLADRIRKGPLPVEIAIDLASQIADALDKAHRQGIVHRDLKPANVFLVRAAGASGAPHCKLLDFGLAKVGPAGVGTLETKLATTPPPAQTAPLTAQGTILGTFQYMSPEQIEGQDADARTDIWAFGCVLYEMLTGRRAFEGKSQASLIASILERQPAAIAELQPMTPPALGRLVRTCLEKNPDNRFHTAHDLWLHLQWVEEGGSAAGLPAPVVAGRKRRDRSAFIAGGIALAALAAAAAWWLKPPPVVANVETRFTHTLAEGQAFTRTGRRTIAISPDGSKIAFIADQKIYLRQMNDLEAQPIRGTELDPLDLAFSPDSQSIAFLTPAVAGGALEGGSLRRILVSGGTATTLCPASATFGVRWQGDKIVFSLGDRIMAVPETSGTPETLITAPNEAAGYTMASPQLVDDGRAVLYTVRTKLSFNEARIVVHPFGGTPRVLIDGGSDGQIVPTGHLLWMRDNRLHAQAINLKTLQLAGGPVPLIEGVRTATATGVGQVGVSDSGTIAFVPGSVATAADLVWLDRAGHEEPTGAPPQAYTYPRISPDGTKVVANTTDGDLDIWIWDFVRRTPTRLTSGPEADSYGVWTPDGRSIVFRSGPSGGLPNIYRRAADGTGSLQRLTNAPASQAPQMVLTDGRILFRSAASDTTAAGPLMIVPLEPGATAEKVFPAQPAPISNAEVSPDGRWIAYQSVEGSSRTEIHVRPFPGVDSGQWQISSSGGTRPFWSRNGRELFYASMTGKLMRAEVQPTRPGGPFAYGLPAELLDVRKYSPGAIGRGLDISPDGQRFLMVKPVSPVTSTHETLVVVTHWFDELRSRVKGK